MGCVTGLTDNLMRFPGAEFSTRLYNSGIFFSGRNFSRMIPRCTSTGVFEMAELAEGGVFVGGTEKK